MVCHVTADNLSADMWAWRKYGQKPIKGSPYPRYHIITPSREAPRASPQRRRHTVHHPSKQAPPLLLRRHHLQHTLLNRRTKRLNPKALTRERKLMWTPKVTPNPALFNRIQMISASIPVELDRTGLAFITSSKKKTHQASWILLNKKFLNALRTKSFVLYDSSLNISAVILKM